MQGILYEEPSVWLFLLVTCIMGGGAAWMTGRAVALAWQPVGRAAIWSVPLAFVVRFIHFALFRGTLLSAQFYLIDLVVVAAIACLAHRFYRSRQMATQYHWLYTRTGPFGWRETTQT